MEQCQILKARGAARELFEIMNAAYWAEGFNREHLLRPFVLEDELRILADAIGFDLTPRHCPLTETFPHAEAAQ